MRSRVSKHLEGKTTYAISKSLRSRVWPSTTTHAVAAPAPLAVPPPAHPVSVVRLPPAIAVVRLPPVDNMDTD